MEKYLAANPLHPQEEKEKNIAYFDYQICTEALAMAAIANRYYESGGKLPPVKKDVR